MFNLITKLIANLIAGLVFNLVGKLVLKLIRKLFAWSRKGVRVAANNMNTIIVWLLVVGVIFLGLDKDVDELIELVIPQ